MIACVRLLVDVEEFVAWGYYERRSQLGGAAAGVVLPIATNQRPCSCQPRIGSERSRGSQLVQHNGVGRIAVLIQEDRERNRLILDEGRCVPSTSGADRSHTRSGRRQLFVSVSDLTGPFAARQSTEVSKEEKHMGLFGPQVPEPVERSVGVGERDVR
jgi:hypothetical protein